MLYSLYYNIRLVFTVDDDRETRLVDGVLYWNRGAEESNYLGNNTKKTSPGGIEPPFQGRKPCVLGHWTMGT